MISIELNGRRKDLEESLTIQDLLRTSNIPIQSLAVAVNSEIVPRSEFEKIRVRNRDQIEIIHAVGGG